MIGVGVASAMLVGGAAAAGATGNGPGICGAPGAADGGGISTYARTVGPPGQIDGFSYTNPGGFVNQVCKS
jgi:hypothetical protein